MQSRSFCSTERKKQYYYVPQEFIEATSSLSKSQIFDAIDNLVPPHDKLDYKSYKRHFHGVLYLEELHFQRELVKFRRDEAYFRVVDSYYGLHFQDVMSLRPGIQIGSL